MKKQSIIKVTMALLMLIGFSGEVRADEVVRYLMSESTTAGSIIRHYTGKIDVACYQNYYSPYFVMYKDGIVLQNTFFMEYMDTIYDFEIYNDTLYFCGKSSYYTLGPAVVGYFDMTALVSGTSTNVAYISMSSLDKVKAIEVAEFASRKHVVGVGESINSRAYMVDLIDEMTYWSINLADVGGDTLSLLDLAITDSLVVVTSKKHAFVMFTKGYLWFLNKPTMPGSSLFPCSVKNIDYLISTDTKYLVRALSWNRFVTACQYWDLFNNTSPNLISYYTGEIYNNGVVIEEAPKTQYRLMDIDNDKMTDVVEVLLSGFKTTPSGISVWSKIYEIPNANPIPVPLQAHFYEGAFFESINNVESMFFDEEHFVTSGYDVTSGFGTPYYMRFKYNVFDGQCLDKSERSATFINQEKEPHLHEITVNTSTQVPIMYIIYEKQVRTGTKCYVYSSNTENNDEEKVE